MSSDKIDKKHFLELLNNIENNHSMIKQISSYMYYHREQSFQIITDLWKKHFLSCSESYKLLSLFYIINEIIILSSKKQKYDYITSFGEILKEIIIHFCLKLNERKENFENPTTVENDENMDGKENLKEDKLIEENKANLMKVYEILEIWEFLLIFSSNFIKELKMIILENVSKDFFN